MTSSGDAPREQGAEGENPLTEAEVERMIAALNAEGPTSTEAPASGAAQEPGRLALILTPVASAEALGALCSVAGLDVEIVPARTGAVVVLEVTPQKAASDGDWDIAELLGGHNEGFPPAAETLARDLVRVVRHDVVLICGDLANDVGIETGLSGQLTARRYSVPEGKAVEGETEDVPAGLILAGADQVVEDLILGRARPGDVPGRLRSGELPRRKALGVLGRLMRGRGKRSEGGQQDGD
ncbi:hypothetical protein [Bogoriella caseilytica]|uniref:Uncharacterized protein n=1 Tax=Bogoriella caseilytica TaxID=56055 RepID=A0A3N2BG08_9MICO|nr:hypothetical protein [Bogoriella caseilytica]ROR74192.1 hypothetical protein EDD31_2593 [Bogoriella caseilytica]